MNATNIGFYSLQKHLKVNTDTSSINVSDGKCKPHVTREHFDGGNDYVRQLPTLLPPARNGCKATYTCLCVQVITSDQLIIVHPDKPVNFASTSSV